MTSVRFFIRNGQQCDLRIEKIAERYCSLQVEPDPVCDDNIVVNLTVGGWCEAVDAKIEVDDTAHSPTVQKHGAESVADVVRIADQSLINTSVFAQGNFLPKNQSYVLSADLLQSMNARSGVSSPESTASSDRTGSAA